MRYLVQHAIASQPLERAWQENAKGTGYPAGSKGLWHFIDGFTTDKYHHLEIKIAVNRLLSKQNS